MNASPSLTPPQRIPIWPFVSALTMTAGYIGFWFLPVLDPPNALGHVVLTTALFLFYITAAYAARHLQHGTALTILVGFGLLYRLILWPIEPSMSDDYHRYIWDGKVQAHGWNPYILPPKSDVLIHLKDHLHSSINHPKFKTIYPPTAQWAFLLSYLVDGQSARGIKAWLFLADLFTIFLLAVFLRRRCRPPGYLLFYLWCPVPIIEMMLDAHIDGIALPFLLATLLAAQRKQPILTGVMLALAIMVKPLPLFLVPLLAWHFRWRPAFKMLAVTALVGIIAYIPYIQAGPSMFTSMLHYSRHWHINGPIFKFLYQWFIGDAVRMGLALGIISFSLLTPFLRMSFEKRFLIPIAAYLMLTPTVYPWYFIWLAPFLVICPTPWLFWLAGTISLVHTVHYFYDVSGQWSLPGFIVSIEFVPIFALMGLQFVKGFVWPAFLRWRERRQYVKARIQYLESEVTRLRRQNDA